MIPQREYRSFLSEWQTIGAVKDTLEVAAAGLGEAFVTGRDEKVLREAWVGVRYAAACGHCQMRMSDAPDMELRDSSGEHGWEIVEALDPWRRRGDEYRHPSSLPVVDDIQRRRRAILPTIRQRSIEKAAKRYGDGTSLLIYANMGLYGAFREEIEASLHDATVESAERFREIAVCWERRVYRLWSSGCELKIDPIDYEECLAKK